MGASDSSAPAGYRSVMRWLINASGPNAREFGVTRAVTRTRARYGVAHESLPRGSHAPVINEPTWNTLRRCRGQRHTR